ncbi:carboxylesterase [Musa troglodytarum]|uniref:Carboxylesterase n=1 Tax=Musa troglodytarum TaxID=320322 RepID=A0A9E7FF59_9LILI|nr:carboxylesterase [Musa troglodytarum]
MPSPSNSMTSIAEEFFKGHPLEAYMDSTVEISDDRRGISLAFGSNYLSTRLYQLTPPEDIELATVLLRPGSFFLDDLSNNMVLREANYGSVRRAFIVCKQDKAIVEEYQRWLIKRSPGAEVKEIDGADHMVMLSKPRKLCNLLLEIADEYK